MNKKIINYILPAFLLIIVFMLGFSYAKFQDKLEDKKALVDNEANVSEEDVCDIDICETPVDDTEEDIEEGAEEEAQIELIEPRAGDVISSPLTIKGRAKGSWFFEATFPVVLTNWDGLIIAESYLEAKSDWMTSEYVEFEGQLTFDKDIDVSNRAALILQKSNPSGLPENDDALEIEVWFEK